ncbi:TRAP transporter small permease [Petrocella sp. FN5]|uniref:TRAP transporter small permease n=1 Tax=Petrocella sp. FN5 TaxID=3032002 RepID=UPI0023DB256B|nr:TRAP transporter small permease [Petrocella sp. FN5]MDF1618568.1 TRAP transporter small permease [Petrocella sp. FN5]
MQNLKFFIRNFEELVSGFFIIITVSVVILNVFLRYVFNMGIFWVEEVATISFIWSVFLGASATYKRRMNIGIDFLTRRGNQKTQTIIKLVVDMMLLIITGYILYLSIIFTWTASIKPTAVLGISSAYVNAALVVGFGLMVIQTIVFLVQDVKDIKILNSRREVL